MPYGYYQMVRVLSMVGFGILALSAKEDKERWIYITLCMLFQPFIKVALGRVLWNGSRCGGRHGIVNKYKIR